MVGYQSTLPTMSGSLTHGGGENVPGIPGARTTRKFMYLATPNGSSHGNSQYNHTKSKHNKTTYLFVFFVWIYHAPTSDMMRTSQ